MKKVIKASSVKDTAYKRATVILDTMKRLFNMMEDVEMEFPNFIDANGLGELYECLGEDIPAFQMSVHGKTVEY